MNASSRQAGHAIAELITAIALSAGILATATPIASAILNQHRLVAATRQLGYEIVRARMEAVGKNAYVRITMIGGTQYHRERSTDGVTYVEDGAPVTLPSGFSLAAGASGTPRFDRQGMGAASTTITVIGPRGLKTVTTNVLGRVTTS